MCLTKGANVFGWPSLPVSLSVCGIEMVATSEGGLVWEEQIEETTANSSFQELLPHVTAAWPAQTAPAAETTTHDHQISDSAVAQQTIHHASSC